MNANIYKMFNGSYIDLSKICSISEAIIDIKFNVSFAIHFQLMDKPVIYVFDYHYFPEVMEQSAKYRYVPISKQKGEYDCAVYEMDGQEYTYLQMKVALERVALTCLQNRINEIIEHWKLVISSGNLVAYHSQTRESH